MTLEIFAGSWGFGGDGYVIARHLANKGINVKVMIIGQKSRLKGDAFINYGIIEKMNLAIEFLDPADTDPGPRASGAGQGCDIVVDAIFGTGPKGSMRPWYNDLIEAINSLNKPTIAVDIPSGLDCDTGAPVDDGASVIAADATVTFAAVKKGYAENPESAKYTGKVYIASIGINPVPR